MTLTPEYWRAENERLRETLVGLCEVIEQHAKCIPGTDYAECVAEIAKAATEARVALDECCAASEGETL